MSTDCTGAVIARELVNAIRPRADSLDGIVFVEKVGFARGNEVGVELDCAKKRDITSAIGLLTVLEAFDVCLNSDELEDP